MAWILIHQEISMWLILEIIGFKNLIHQGIIYGLLVDHTEQVITNLASPLM